MVKTILSVTHQGLRDWIMQRLSAVYMAVFFSGFLLYLMTHSGLSFAEWHSLFSQEWMKIATLLAIFLLLYHTWVGIWTIFTDYVKPYVLRAILDCLVLLMLAACFIWGILILWSV